MEENEKEVIDETIEETQEEVNEVEETESDDGSPTLEDYEKLKKEKETLLAQKEHWRKKAESVKSEKPALTKSNGLSREEAILYAKGFTDDEVELAIKLSKVNGVSILEAAEDDYLASKRNARIQKDRSEKASLGASTGSFKTKKPIEEMSNEEHKDLFNQLASKL